MSDSVDGRIRWSAIATVPVMVTAMTLLLLDPLAAQEMDDPGTFDVHGTVADEGGRPMVGAWVSLAGSDWGSVTDGAGRFRLPDLTPGRIELVVEQLGYDTLTWAGAVTADTGPITLTLTAAPLLLEGLNVVANRFERRRRATATSVQTLDREDLATSHYDTVWRMISARSGLAETPCRGLTMSSLCVRSRGRVAQASVYIDEVPVIAGLDYLDSFRPWDLYMVEVYGRGRHIRAYTTQFMERAAKNRLQPIPFIW